MSGKAWEAAIAAENQKLLYARRAMVTRVPTHYFGDVPARDPKSDFVGVLRGGRMVAIEAKADSGQLSKMQRAYLQGVTRFGGLALVYRRIGDERHLCCVDEQGNMERKSAATQVTEDTWLDAVEERGL